VLTPFCLTSNIARRLKTPDYSAAFPASTSTTAILATNSSGSPCLSFKYSGLLYEIQTFPAASSATRIFSGKSIATLGAASISGVPAFGLPKISSFVFGIFIPTFAASPL